MSLICCRFFSLSVFIVGYVYTRIAVARLPLRQPMWFKLLKIFQLQLFIFFGYFKQLQCYGQLRPNISHTIINIKSLTLTVINSVQYELFSTA